MIVTQEKWISKRIHDIRIKEMRKEENSQNNRKEQGITLIALVVTIVILLILSGITIGTLMGDGGVIKKAQEAKKTTIVSVIKENIEIDAKIEPAEPTMADISTVTDTSKELEH